MNINVVNVRTTSKYHYIGRGTQDGQRSALANPFKLTNGEKRGATIERYRQWLWDKVSSQDKAVMTELFDLVAAAEDGPLNLGCWCAPQACHGDVVKSCIEWLSAASTDNVNL